MPRAHRFLSLSCIVLIALACFGCAVQPTAPTEWRVTLITATGGNTPGNIQGVQDRFTFNGKIHAHATLVAEGPVTPATSIYTMKWFNGAKLVHERSAEYTIGTSPYYLVHAIPGSVLGVGQCHVELHSSRGLLASREFSVRER